MAYKRRYAKKRNYRRKRNNNYSMAKKALYLAKKANKKELKWNSTTINLQNFTQDTAVAQVLSVTAKGDGNNNREGDSLTPTSVSGKFSLLWGNALSCRIILYRCVGALITAESQILDSLSVNSFKSEDYRYQTQFLMDRTYTKRDNQTAVQINFKRKLGKICTYTESSVPQTGSICMLVISNLDSVDSPTCDFTGITRMYFHE